jgi:hypothetical protein
LSCCYITVDPETQHPKTEFGSLSFPFMGKPILFWKWQKNITFLLFSSFYRRSVMKQVHYMAHLLRKSNAVLWLTHFRIQRYVAATCSSPSDFYQRVRCSILMFKMINTFFSLKHVWWSITPIFRQQSICLNVFTSNELIKNYFILSKVYLSYIEKHGLNNKLSFLLLSRNRSHLHFRPGEKWHKTGSATLVLPVWPVDVQ